MFVCHWGIKVWRFITKSKQAKLVLTSQPRKEGRTQVFDLACLVAVGHQSICRSKDADLVPARGDGGTALSCCLLSPGGENREHLVRGVRTILTCLVLVIDMGSICIQHKQLSVLSGLAQIGYKVW